MSIFFGQLRLRVSLISYALSPFLTIYTSLNMASTSADSQSSIAQKTWAMANNIETISSVDDIYRYDKKQQQDILAAKPWEKEYVI